MEEQNATQPDVKPSVEKPKNNNTLLIVLLIILFLISSGITIYTVYQNNQLKKQISLLEKQQNKPTAVKPKPTTKLSPSPTNGVDMKQSTLEEFDDTWNLYTNYKLGFSIKIPKKSDYWIGGCKWEGNNDISNSNNFFSVPVNVYEDENSVYISHEYTSVFTKEDTGNGIIKTDCKIVPTTLDVLKKERRTYHILVKSIQSDEELENFIKKSFGSSCKIGKKTVTEQAGVLNVRVKGDGMNLETSKCFINYGYRIKYDTNKNKLYTWDIGQDVTFQDEKYPELQNMMDKSFKTL